MAEVVISEADMAAAQTLAYLLDLASMGLGRTITPITTLRTITHPITHTTPLTIHPG
jgi:hypothetical protein